MARKLLYQDDHVEERQNPWMQHWMWNVLVPEVVGVMVVVVVMLLWAGWLAGYRQGCA